MLQVLHLDEKYASLKAEDIKEFTPQMEEDYVNQATGQVGIGHAVGYPFGVIIVILAVNFLNVVFRFDVEEEKKAYEEKLLAEKLQKKKEKAASKGKK